MQTKAYNDAERQTAVLRLGTKGANSQPVYAARSSDCSHFLWYVVVELVVLTWCSRHIDVLRPQMSLDKCQLWHYILSASHTLALSVPKL